MDYTLLALSGIALVTVLLLGIGVVYSAVHYLWKVALIALGAAAVITGYFVFDASLGYPLRRPELPERFIFAGGHVREPLPSKQDPGAIYLLILERGQSLPRTIQIPYSKENHKKVLQGKKDSAEGKTVYMTRKPAEESEGKAGGKAGQGQGRGHQTPGTAQGGGRGGNARGGGGSTGNAPMAGNAPGDLDIVPPPSTFPDKDASPSLIGE